MSIKTVHILGCVFILGFMGCSDANGTGSPDVIAQDTAPAVDTASPPDTGGAQDTASGDTVLGDASMADANPEDTGAGQDGTISDTGTQLEDATADTAPLMDTAPIEDTAPIQDTMPAPDTAPPMDTTPPKPKPLWLLSIDNPTQMLQIVDIATGKATNMCKLIGYNGSYPSLTFSRSNGLYASRSGNALDRIDPCSCQVSPLGSYGGFSGVNGITADPGENLFGVATTQDDAISIAASNGAAVSLGDLGINFTTAGATWSQDDKTLYSINGADNGLYTINPKTGEATLLTYLNYNFGTVGIELHPANNTIYACSSSADLLEIDPLTGDVTVIGPMGQAGSCTNLAAPWLSVECVDNLIP